MIRLALLLLFIAGAASAQTPTAPDPRMRTVYYSPDQVVRLQVPTNFHTAILFGADETVENVAIGDSAAWQATLNEAGAALFLKPVRPSGATNMTVITSARVYSFELSSAYGPTPDAPYTLRFRYADPTFGSNAAATARPGRYRLSGARALRPAAIADDGRRTLIEWRSDQVIPALFALDEHGLETLIEGHVRDGLYVVDGVYPALVMRLDRQSARASRLRERLGR